MILPGAMLVRCSNSRWEKALGVIAWGYGAVTCTTELTSPLGLIT